MDIYQFLYWTMLLFVNNISTANSASIIYSIFKQSSDFYSTYVEQYIKKKHINKGPF